MQQINTGERLTGPTFTSRCPIPDIKANTKIVAVCGINDWSDLDPSIGEASPRRSGWVFSDFYLFHHLFQKVSNDQVWLTCVSPKYAVDKYGEYVHGDSAPGAMSARRVVLDKDMLNELGDVRTVPANDLLERFLASLREACSEARRHNRHVLVLVLAHGNQDNFSMVLGGEGDPSSKPPLLTIDLFKRAIGTRNYRNNLCLLTTACYGGGWAINPDLNITTSATPSNESLSWPISGTANRRLCGSPYASAIADSLLRLTIEDLGPEKDDIQQMPTYAGFVELVRKSVQKVDPRIITTTGSAGSYSVHQPMFSAENDDWVASYSTRTGFPLNKFQERWMLLKPPRSDGGAGGAGGAGGTGAAGVGTSRYFPSGWFQFGSGVRLEPGGRLYSHFELLELVKREGKVYLRSNPGIIRPKDTSLNSTLVEVLDMGECPSAEGLASTLRQLDYRMVQITATATIYKNFLEIDMPDCHLVDTDSCPERVHSNWSKVFDLVVTYPLFDPPPTGHQFSKGVRYITACIIKTDWSRDQAVAKLDSLVEFKNQNLRGTGVSCVTGTSRSLHTIDRLGLDTDPIIRKAVQGFAKAVKKSLRDPSSREGHRRRRSAIPGQCLGGASGSGGVLAGRVSPEEERIELGP